MRCENCTLLCIKCIDSVDIDNIECIVCFDLCIDSVDIDIIEWFVNTVDMKIKACNAVNAMFVDTGVCGSYTTLYTE